MYIADIETDGLDPSRIHCAVFYNMHSREFTEFTPDNIKELKPFLIHIENDDALCMHNGIGFDLKVFKKLLNYQYDGKYYDTLLMARILWPDISLARYVNNDGKEVAAKGKHSLEAWGIRLGVKKPEHEDWENYSEDMLRRCREDVKITIELMKKIQKECKDIGFKQRPVFKLEHQVWKIIEEQADYGWKLDINKANRLKEALEKKVRRTEQKLDKYLPYNILKPYADTVCKSFKKDGEITKNALTWTKNRYKEVGGDFCRVQFEKVDINSPNQLKDFLLEKGWEPSEWNYKKDKYKKPLRVNGEIVKTSPKSPSKVEEWEEVSEKLKIPAVVELAEYKKSNHRLGQVKGFLRNVRKDSRIEAQANTCGTNTARMTQRIVVNVPKSEDKVFLGKHMRSLFTVPENKVLVGVDASGLEARVQAHYVYPYDPDFSKELLEGDIHSKNAEAFGIQRSLAKNAYYAIMYGCAPYTFAKMIGADESKATEIYNDFWDNNPGLKSVKQELEKEFKRLGFIWGLDGRPLTVRRKSSLVNTLFQSCGSIIMKHALVYLYDEIKEKELIVNFVGNFHDEFQMESNLDCSKQVGKLACNSLEVAGKNLGINVPIIGEYKIGKNWAETH